MSNKPISTRPVNDNEKLLREKFYESIAAQSDLMDKLSERLLTWNWRFQACLRPF